MSTSSRGTTELPELLMHQLEGAYDAKTRAALKAGYHAAAARPVTLRANTLKTTPDEVEGALKAAGLAAERTSWYSHAFIVREVRERALWALPAYQEGAIYLQSLSSMLPPLALEPQPGADILDMCAAPGGKTSQMAALAGGTAHITACELNAPRAEKLAYNLEKLGAGGVNIMRVDARKLDAFFSFDQVLVDAPCTGAGTIRAGDEKAARRFTPHLLAKVTRSQAALLDRALTVLKPGGTLVYSTCSVLPQENEEQVRTVLKRHRGCEIVPLPFKAGDIDGVEALPCSLEGALTICPNELFEGFFIAKIKKNA